jgi:hypothetical protein
MLHPSGLDRLRLRRAFPPSTATNRPVPALISPTGCRKMSRSRGLFWAVGAIRVLSSPRGRRELAPGALIHPKTGPPERATRRSRPFCASACRNPIIGTHTQRDADRPRAAEARPAVARLRAPLDQTRVAHRVVPPDPIRPAARPFVRASVPTAWGEASRARVLYSPTFVSAHKAVRSRYIRRLPYSLAAGRFPT